MHGLIINNDLHPVVGQRRTENNEASSNQSVGIIIMVRIDWGVPLPLSLAKTAVYILAPNSFSKA